MLSSQQGYVLLVSEDILDHYKSLLEKNPQDTNILQKLASVLFESKQYSEARKYYKMALQINPDMPPIEEFFKNECLKTGYDPIVAINEISKQVDSLYEGIKSLNNPSKEIIEKFNDIKGELDENLSSFDQIDQDYSLIGSTSKIIDNGCEDQV